MQFCYKTAFCSLVAPHWAWRGGMATRKPEAGASRATPSAPSKTIVLADDDGTIVEALGELLRNKDYEVHGASDGLEALRAIRKLKPDCVILDIVMPKLDGSRVCAMIRHDPHLRHIPVIVLSALSPEQLRRFPALSADAYVAKASLAVMANNVLRALKHLEERGRGDLGGGIFGYEGFRARNLIGQMLSARHHWDTLIRSFPHAVLELDAEGQILMANTEAARIIGRQESRMIGEPLAVLLPPRERQAFLEVLGELTKKRVGEQARMVATFGGREASLRLASAVEGGRCTGFLVTLEPVRPEGGGRKPERS